MFDHNSCLRVFVTYISYRLIYSRMECKKTCVSKHFSQSILMQCAIEMSVSSLIGTSTLVHILIVQSQERKDDDDLFWSNESILRVQIGHPDSQKGRGGRIPDSWMIDTRSTSCRVSTGLEFFDWPYRYSCRRESLEEILIYYTACNKSIKLQFFTTITCM